MGQGHVMHYVFIAHNVQVLGLSEDGVRQQVSYKCWEGDV